MFKALFLAVLLLTLAVNILFLFATKEKPPDLAASTFVSVDELSQPELSSLGQRRLFLRSNDLYDYLTSTQTSGQRNAESKRVSARAGGQNASTTRPASGGASAELPDTGQPPLRGDARRTREGGGAVNLVQRQSEDVSERGAERAKGESGPISETGRNQAPAKGEQVPNGDSAHERTRSLNISVKSSKDQVLVKVDNVIIYESKSRQGGDRSREGGEMDEFDESKEPGRGIHVLVLSQYDGLVMAKRVFDTYSPNQDEELCFFLNMVSEGRILVMAVRDEASFKMPSNSVARELLEKLGSRHIMKLRWRDMWAFIGRKRTPLETGLRLGEPARRKGRPKVVGELEERNLAEALARSSRFADWAPAVVAEASVRLAERASQPDCKWNSADQFELARRVEFCSKIEGYGHVCDCSHPAPISFKPVRLQDSQLEQVPILVMAGNRPYYLYRMLRSLLASTGANSSMVTVFIDGFYHEPLAVSRLFNLRAIQQRPRARRSARISHHYKSSLSVAFELFPLAEFAIIFEEDLDIAQDALVYFSQTLGLLKADPSLYCVSAWNDQGYEHSVGSANLLYRIETMPGLGWMLSRKLYKHELEPNWPSAEQAHDWDMWIRTESMRKGRECIIPDISRTFHFGSTGTNINSYFQRQYFSHHAFNLVPQDKFDNLNLLTKEPYERLMEQLIGGANVVQNQIGKDNSSEAALHSLCSLADFKRPHLMGAGASEPSGGQSVLAGETNVIYIDMIDRQDFSTWLKLAKCWRIWDLDARGQHNSMWRLFLGGKHTIVVGVPVSPYAKFKPPHLVPFKL